jgi:hypothetical protein
MTPEEGARLPVAYALSEEEEEEEVASGRFVEPNGATPW